MTLPFAKRGRVGFTLVEMLVVVSIIGVLVALLLPAVQYARETARRAQCKNNLRQLGIALHAFHASHNEFPAGNDTMHGHSHSWVTRILPQLEQSTIYSQYDWSKDWDDTSSNFPLCQTTLPILRCPSGIVNFPGDTDYGGMTGSSLSGLPFGEQPGQAWGSGMLLRLSPETNFVVSMGQVIDGSSNTIMVGEVTDRFSYAGYWGNGVNCFAHENEPINRQLENGIHSFHGNTANVLMTDGSIRVLTEDMGTYLLGALCTRDGREIIQW